MAEAPITLKETLELLRAVKPEQLHHYTKLVSQAIRDGELAFQDRDGHSIQIESSPRSTFNRNGLSFAWTFEGIVDGRACEVTVGDLRTAIRAALNLVQPGQHFIHVDIKQEKSVMETFVKENETCQVKK